MIHQRYPNTAATQKGRNFFTLPRGQWLAMPDLPVKLPMAAIKLAESDQRAGWLVEPQSAEIGRIG